MKQPTNLPDSWSSLRRLTSARIALGRAGGSLPTSQVLDFAVAHAAARDAVHTALDGGTLIASLVGLGVRPLLLATAASDRETYLRRPDLGRRLDDSSRTTLATLDHPECDVAIIVADGLSAGRLPVRYRDAACRDRIVTGRHHSGGSETLFRRGPTCRTKPPNRPVLSYGS